MARYILELLLVATAFAAVSAVTVADEKNEVAITESIESVARSGAADAIEGMARIEEAYDVESVIRSGKYKRKYYPKKYSKKYYPLYKYVKYPKKRGLYFLFKRFVKYYKARKIYGYRKIGYYYKGKKFYTYKKVYGYRKGRKLVYYKKYPYSRWY